MRYQEILGQHELLDMRKQRANEKLNEITAPFSGCNLFAAKQISVFAAGSLGRKDAGGKSDLDLFVISELPDCDRGKLDDLEILAKLIEINNNLKFPPFSNDGQFLKVYSIEEMKGALGHPRDDSENLFTARMLLLLESLPVCNIDLYEQHITAVVNHYFRDYPDHKAFKPLFLLNDMLRYWRTLCLNYEKIRNEEGKPWRKKNINLKFSRMITVFGSVLPLISLPVTTVDDFIMLTKLTPLERLAHGLDRLEDSSMCGDFELFLDNYEKILQWKEDSDVEAKMKDRQTKQDARERANQFSTFLYKALSHNSIALELRKFLVI